MIILRGKCSDILTFREQFTGDKEKGRLSKRVLISTPCAYQGVKNVHFSENLACFLFLKHPFWDLPFCLINYEIDSQYPNIKLFEYSFLHYMHRLSFMYTRLLITAELQLASYLKETLVQVFSCEFCKISKNIFFTEHICATAFIWNTVHFSNIGAPPLLSLVFEWIVRYSFYAAQLYSNINKQCKNQCTNSNKKWKLKKLHVSLD